MLEQLHETLWLVDGDLVSFYGFPYPTRSVIARLPNDDLWVWSPVRLTTGLRQAVDRLGHVRHLISPNKIHHLYMREWSAAYPQALLWGPQSTIAKRSDLAFQMPLENDPPAAWAEQFEQAWFRGSMVLDEIVFFHQPSGTVILADLIEAFDESFLHEHWSWWQRWIARLDGITARRPGAPREWRLSFLNRGVAREARDRVLSWPCERVIVAHGEWQRSGGHAYLARALAWLG
jgi:hypothetical protein